MRAPNLKSRRSGGERRAESSRVKEHGQASGPSCAGKTLGEEGEWASGLRGALRSGGACRRGSRERMEPAERKGEGLGAF